MAPEPGDALRKVIIPPSNGPPRYTQRAMPPYRYVPGLQPHPVVHPEGHSYNAEGKHPPAGPLLPPEQWMQSEDYLYGADLYNQGYWWEAHEAWEGLWQQTDKAGVQGRFIQGLIQVSAAHLKHHVGQLDGVERLLARAFEHLGFVQVQLTRNAEFMGLNLDSFVERVHQYFQPPGHHFPFIEFQDAARQASSA